MNKSVTKAAGSVEERREDCAAMVDAKHRMTTQPFREGVEVGEASCCLTEQM